MNNKREIGDFFQKHYTRWSQNIEKRFREVSAIDRVAIMDTALPMYEGCIEAGEPTTLYSCIENAIDLHEHGRMQ